MIVVGKCLHGRLAGCRGGSRSSLRCAQPRHLLRRPGTVVLCTPEPGNASTSTTSTKADVTSTSSTSGLPGPVLLEGAGAGGVLPAQGQDQEWRWEESSDALTAYGVLAAVLVAGAIPNPILRSDNASDLFYFVALAVCTQYIGAHRSLTTAQRQQLSIKEGLLAPVLASVSLFTCYLIIRFLPDINLSTLINAYFWLLGSFAASGALIPVLRQTGGPLANKSISFDVPDGWLADEHGKPITRAEIAPSDVIAVTGALTLATAHLITQDYTLNNTMACLIATDILQLIGIRSFRVAGALLVGLLLYDVFWVFGSPMVIDNGDNVMLTVATSDLITGPSRLLFPRTPGGAGEAADFPYSLLGLGDIAIPGLLACLALRYDASRAVDMAGRAEVAFNAMKDAWSKLPADASGKMMADTGSIAADAAFDKFADTEQKQRQQTLAASMNNGNTTATPAGNTSSTTSTSSSDAVRIPATEAVLSQRTYFVPVMVAYVGGLLVAFAANSITHMGQPALLYIVPSTLGALLVLAATRQEIRQLWSFTDVPSFGVPSATKDTAAGKESGGENSQNN